MYVYASMHPCICDDDDDDDDAFYAPFNIIQAISRQTHVCVFNLQIIHSDVCGVYRIYSMYRDRNAWANSVDSDEMPQNVTFHLSLHCLSLIHQFWVVNCSCLILEQVW